VGYYRVVFEHGDVAYESLPVLCWIAASGSSLSHNDIGIKLRLYTINVSGSFCVNGAE